MKKPVARAARNPRLMEPSPGENRSKLSVVDEVSPIAYSLTAPPSPGSRARQATRPSQPRLLHRLLVLVRQLPIHGDVLVDRQRLPAGMPESNWISASAMPEFLVNQVSA